MYQNHICIWIQLLFRQTTKVKALQVKMIKPFLSEANAKGDKVYLETQNIKNVPIYEKYGFKFISTQYLNKQITHFAMVK